MVERVAKDTRMRNPTSQLYRKLQWFEEAFEVCKFTPVGILELTAGWIV